MATREHQGLQIALILFVMITVALGVTSYVFYTQAVKAEADKIAARDELRVEQTKNDGLDAQNRLLKWMVGAMDMQQVEIDALYKTLATKNPDMHKEMKQIEANFKADMALFQGSNVVLGDGTGWQGAQNWSTLPDYLVQVVQKKNLEWEAEKKRADQAEAEKTAQIQAHLNKVKQAEQAQQQAQQSYLQAKADFDSDRDRFKKTTADVQQKLNDKSVQLKKEQDEAAKKINALKSQVVALENLNRKLKETVTEYEAKDYDKPQGSIRWVNQHGRIVYIDLGIADGLRRQITFSVYDRDETNHVKAVPKASIEVTELLDQHLAKARILEDDLSNPILPGDLIFTPTWAPGRHIRFALAGFMDLNGDGKSDRQIVKNLITLNGGIIDAEVKDDGELVGQMTPRTRYLVLGEEPRERSELMTNWQKLWTGADKLGVEKIPLEKLLGFMGYKGEVTTTMLGRRAAAPGANQPSPFRKRRPEIPSSPSSAY